MNNTTTPENCVDLMRLLASVPNRNAIDRQRRFLIDVAATCRDTENKTHRYWHVSRLN